LIDFSIRIRYSKKDCQPIVALEWVDFDMDSLLARFRLARQSRLRGQSFLELALVLPVLLIILLGMVEVVFFIGRYLDVLDLTREAARFASVRDPFVVENLSTVSCSNPEPFNFYYHTACIFSPPPDSSATCTDPEFCNGLNPYILLNPALDDVVISVFTITDHAVSNAWPSPSGYWALSDHDSDTAHNANWQTDCQGNVVRTSPNYTVAKVNQEMLANAPTNKGFVAVELYYCYDQVLAVPLMNIFLPNPLRLHAYTLMPLPAAQPSPTPKP